MCHGPALAVAKERGGSVPHRAGVRKDAVVNTNDVRAAARQAGDNPALVAAARVGFAVNGVLHLVIAWLGLQLAWGGGGGSADQSGALQTLASTGGGRLLLWVAVVGFLALAVWQATEAVVGEPKLQDRAKAVATGVLYLFLSFSSLNWARGPGASSSTQQSVDFTSSLMGKPAGRVLVAVLGLVIVGVGGYFVAKGWRRTFLADLAGHPGPLAEKLGRVGYVAKGAAVVLVGILFVLAAAHGAPGEATGLDGALRTLLHAPYGPVLLTAVSLGLAAYAGYSFVRARYARL